jgi:hypothetical protein
MIVVRDIYHVRLGRTPEALVLWREILAQAKRAHCGATSMSLLTDLVGPHDTIVVEKTFEDLASFERGAARLMQNDQWRASYQTFTALAESAHREIFTVVGDL